MVNSSVLATLIAFAVIVAVAAVATVHRRTSLAKITALLLSATTLVAIGVTGTAGATTLTSQTPIGVSNSTTSYVAGASVTLTHTGGSGSGAVSFATRSKGCIITTGVLTVTSPVTCAVTVTKLGSTVGSTVYRPYTSAVKNFTFTAASQAAFSISNSSLTSLVNVPVTVTTSGGSGAGKIGFAVSGTGCIIKGSTLKAGANASCVVTASKGASGIYKAATATQTFTFSTEAQAALSVTNFPLQAALGTNVRVAVAGGSGAGKYTFAVSGSGCAITNKAVLSATGSSAVSCDVTVTKGASGSYAAATATATFLFQDIQYSAKLTSINGSSSGIINFDGNASAGGDTWFLDNYYSGLDNWLFDYVTAGHAVTETWLVTTGGHAAANVPVSFDQTYAGGNGGNSATWSGNGTGGLITGTTNSHGVVSFTFTNTNSATGLNPNDTTTGAGANGNEGSYPWSRGALVVGTPATGLPQGEFGSTVGSTNLIWDAGGAGAAVVNQTTDLVDLIVIPGSGALTDQAPFSITNATLSNLVGANVTVASSGGSGTGAVTYSVTGTGCSINSTTGALSATGAATCVVTAAKAADSTYGAASATETFTFTAAPDNPTVANPDVATLTSVTGAASSQINDTANGDNYFINSYYNNSDHWYQYYFNEGATVTENWHVVGSNGQPLANAAVTLYGNLNYSSACGVTFAAPNTGINACANGGGSGQGSITGSTDSSGNVSFTLVNTNTNTGAAPTDTTTPGGAEGWENAAASNSIDTILQVGTDTYTGNPTTTVNEQTDRVDLLLIPAAPVVTPTDNPTFANPDKAVMTSVTGGVNSTPIDATADGDNWFINAFYSPTDHWNFTYVTPGSSITETWHVTGSDGSALQNQTVTLETGFANGTATWSATGISNGDVTGKTDASGNVSFTLTNTNSSGGSAPGDTSTEAAALAAENGGSNAWTRMALIVGTATSNNGSATDLITANPNPTVNQATDLVDFIVIPA